MRIDELFDREPGELRRLDPKKFEQATLLTNIVAAWDFNIGEHHYAIYFDQCARIPNKFNCGFVVFYDDAHRDTHMATGFNTPLMVFTNVFEALRLFITENDPEEVSFSGYSPKQQELYLKMVTRFKSKIPSGYTVKMPEEYENRIRIQKL
jgi:hypothetical protein